MSRPISLVCSLTQLFHVFYHLMTHMGSLVQNNILSSSCQLFINCCSRTSCWTFRYLNNSRVLSSTKSSEMWWYSETKNHDVDVLDWYIYWYLTEKTQVVPHRHGLELTEKYWWSKKQTRRENSSLKIRNNSGNSLSLVCGHCFSKLHSISSLHSLFKSD